MALIDRIGRFRGVPTQGIMGESTGGFPQFVVQFLATEYFDEITGEWIDWSQYQQTMTAYLILFNASKALLNYEQVMKAFNWDGADLNALQSDDFGDLQVQFVVKENVYNGKVNLRIEWVDAYDASTTGGGGGNLTPLDANSLKTMTAKFGRFMKQAPKAAPVRGGTVPTPPPARPAPVADAGITKQAAWAGLNESFAGSISDDDMGTAFLAATDEVVASTGTDEDNLSNVDWANVLSIATASLTA